MNWRCGIMLAVLSLVLGACTTLPDEQASLAEFAAAQKSGAVEAQASGDLLRAALLWRSVLALEPGSEEAAGALQGLERQIDEEAAAQLRAAERAYQRGNRRAGDGHMLKVLTLKPGQPQALERLGRSALATARAQVKMRTPEAYGEQAGPLEPSEVSLFDELSSLAMRGDHAGLVSRAAGSGSVLSPPEQELVRNAHTALADAAETSGRLDVALEEIQAAMIARPMEADPLIDRALKLRNELGQRAYREGSRLMQRDLDGAIEALESALRYNPYNGDAQRKLEQARTLRRNLRKIEASR